MCNICKNKSFFCFYWSVEYVSLCLAMQIWIDPCICDLLWIPWNKNACCKFCWKNDHKMVTSCLKTFAESYGTWIWWGRKMTEFKYLFCHCVYLAFYLLLRFLMFAIYSFPNVLDSRYHGLHNNMHILISLTWTNLKMLKTSCLC